MPNLFSARMLYILEMVVLGVPSMFLLGWSGLAIGLGFIVGAAQSGLRFTGPGELALFVFLLAVCVGGLVALGMLARVSWIYLSRGCSAIPPVHILIGICLAFLPFVFNGVLVSFAAAAGFVGVVHCLYATGLVLAVPVFHLFFAWVHAPDRTPTR